MENLDAYLDKFSESGKQILESALAETRKRQQHFISPEHILFALMTKESELFDSVMTNASINPKAVRLAVEKRLKNSPVHNGIGFRISPDATEIFKLSMDRARSQGRRVIDAEDIITVFTTVKRDLFDDILQNPESPIEYYKRNKRNELQSQLAQRLNLANQAELEVKQKEWRAFHDEQKKFLSNISWEDVIKNNRFLSGLTALGGVGSSGGGIIGDEIRYSQNLSSSFSYKLENDRNFNQEEIITSLKNEVEHSLKQNKLKITKVDFSSSSSFLFEYQGENLTGQIKIVGQLTNNYFKLSVNHNETCVRKK